MSKPDSEQGSTPPEEGLLEEGWASADEEGGGGDFAVSHTTVDPNLLERLMALDSKEAQSASAAPPRPVASPDRRDKTVTLDLNDLEVLGGEDDDDEDAEEIGDGEIEDEAAAPAEQAEATREDAISAAFDRKAPSDRRQIGAARGGVVAAPVAQDPASLAAAGPSIEIDQEFAQEKTQIFVSAIDDEPTRAKLKVIQGGGQQKEYLLARDRVTLGRGTDNDILVPDIAISRQHCEIKRLPGGTFRLADMQSGNGTKLNGARVLDAELLGGDRIEIGSTILEFVVTGPGASRSPGDRKINYHPSESQSARPAAARTAAPARAPIAAPAPIADYSAAAGPGNSTMTHFQVQAIQAQRTSNTLVTVLIAGLGVIFLAMAGLIGATVYLNSQKPEDERVVNKPAADYFKEGANHVKAKEWDKAEEKFTIATDLAKDEREFQIRKDAELQLERVRKEKNNQKALQRGRALFEQGDHLEAITRLEAVNSGSAYYQEARDLIPLARDKYAEQLTAQANQDFDAKNYAEADRKAQLALKTHPEHAGALALQKKIAELPSEERPALVVREPRLPTDPALKPPKEDKGDAVALVTPPKEAKPPKEETTPKEVKPPKEETPPKEVAANNTQNTGSEGNKPAGAGVVDLTPGLGMYRNKRFGEAIGFFKKVAAEDSSFLGQKAGGLAASIQEFQGLYDQGNQAYASNNYDGATTALTRALGLDKKISGSGYHAREIKQKLAEAYYQKARAAFNGNSNERAGSNAKKALSYDPNHAGNRQLLDQLESKGKSMYIDAFNKKKSDPQQAKRIARTIVAMLPESSETHKKAQQLIQEP
jgi:pSer/pThr/pTyr-binding forkhead associated (FHA) protein/tetratricopeptide (TPR) repeat protein